MLLATFTHARKLQMVLEQIGESFEVVSGKVFILKDEDDPQKRILTYNIVKQDTPFSDSVRNSISLHRKKETNTLYTINALNAVVKEQNNGELDKAFAVDWEEYRNCILLVNSEDVVDETIKKINTRLIKVTEL
jgi:hypothetical protein